MRKKITTVITTVTKQAKKTLTTTRAQLARTRKVLRKFFRDHGEQIAHDPSYAAALITVVACLVDIATSSTQVRYTAQKLTDAYIALHRLLHPRGWGDDDDLGDEWA